MATITTTPSTAAKSPCGSASLPPASCSCGVTSERVRYFPGQLVTADDMLAEQEYLRSKLRRHNRLLHGWGVVCGCAVEACPDATKPWQVCVNPGYVITMQGDEIWIRQPVTFDLAGDTTQAPDPCADPSPCLPAGKAVRPAELREVYLAVCYRECQERPVRAHPIGCTCDESACEYSRIRESFNLMLLLQRPQAETLGTQIGLGFYGSDCPACPDYSCVVLAFIRLPQQKTENIAQTNINYSARHLLPGVAELASAVTVISASPADGSIVGAANGFSATFNRAMDPATIYPTNVSLTGQIANYSVSYQASSRTVTLTSVDGQGNPHNLPSGQYTATIMGGINGVKDICGVPMPGTFTWTFTVS